MSVSLATDKQKAYLQTLAAERTLSEQMSADCGSATLSKSMASYLINALKGMPRTASSAPSTSAKATPGYYVRGQAYYVVVENKSKTSTYAKVLAKSEAGRWFWAYAPGVGVTLADSTPLTLREAASFGHLHGVCIRCCADLTDPESVQRGIGPVCAKKMGF